MRASTIQRLTLAAAVLFIAYLAIRDLGPGRGIQPTDPDLQCEAGYSVCFTPASSINKAFPEPFYLKNLVEPISGTDRSSRRGSALHYPGDVFRSVDLDPCCQGGNFGLTRTRQTTRGGGGTALPDPGIVLFVQNANPSAHSEWRPDRIVGVSTSSTRRVEEEYRLFGDNTHLLKVVMTCIPAGSNCTVTIGAVSADEQVTIAGYRALRVVLNSGTSRALNYHIVFRDPPTTMTTPDGISYVYATYTGPTNTLIALVPDHRLSIIPSLFTQTDAHIQNATAAWQDWYRQFAPPSRCTTDWCRERYYRALTNVAYNLFREYPGTPSGWRDSAGTPRWAMSPGKSYYGVWIWDSFFAAWMAVNNCRTEACVDTFMDSLRILDAHQFSDGQYPRQIRYATWDFSDPGTWQAPGGWSFAVDQADQRFGTTRWCTEFYDNLTHFHNYVRTKDADRDNRFEWGGTNSGWDGSIRWDFGEPNEALDLNAWMILDAESLKNCAQRIRPTDVQLWTDRLALYKTGFRGLCVNNFCYDRATSGSALSTIRTNAMYFGLLADAVTTTEAAAMASELYNASTFGPNAAGHAMLPTISRSDPGFTPNDVKCWSGALWVNTNLVAYLGLLRQGLLADADALRHNTMTTLEQSGFGFEQYNSANIAGTISCFGTGNMYAWTDTTYALMAAPLTLPLLSTGCLPSWSCGAWGPWTDPANACGTRTRQCTDANACFPVRTETQTQACPVPCTDADADTYYASTNCGTAVDCDDANPLIHPDATESCSNTVDDDCDGTVNEGCACTPVWTCGAWGTCANNEQTRTCNDYACNTAPRTETRTCSGTCTPGLTEICNGVDDDCDGIVDEPPIQNTFCVVGCRPGNRNCVNGALTSCANLATPTTETCDGRDNDFDCLIDEGYQTRCYACTPTQEVCDGVDNDCDGEYDEGFTRPCTTPTGQVGTQECRRATWTDCAATSCTPSDELCNGVDDDCDGIVDEGCACTGGQTRPCGTDVGECVRGTETCSAGGAWGSCVGSTGPTTEVCGNGLDEDCDGAIDEGCQVCAPGSVRACTAADLDPGLQTCNAQGTGYNTCCSSYWQCGAYGPCEAGTQRRDCADRDACTPATTVPMISRSCVCTDGQSPRRCTTTGGGPGLQACASGQWAACVACTPAWACTTTPCQAGQWTRTCTDATGCRDPTVTVEACTMPCATDADSDGYYAEASCTTRDCDDANPLIHPDATESCNARDDDCDGSIDDGLTRTCLIGLNPGAQTCTLGAWGACHVASYTTATCADWACTLDLQGQYLSSTACQAACQCSPNWDCTTWSAYDHGTCGTRTRQCTDTNHCPNSTVVTEERLPCPYTICGDRVAEAGEACDGPDLRGQTCAALDPQYAGGTPTCTATCDGYNTAACVKAGPAPLKHYGCSKDNVCVEDPDGQYVASHCNNACPKADLQAILTTPISATILILTLLAGLLLWATRRRR